MSTFPTDAQERKNAPMARGLLDYFPDALLAVAQLSQIGNDQHNPGQPLHWAREKSTDHADCIMRHLAQRGTMDEKVRHTTKVAWRALALLQTELEEAAEPMTLADLAGSEAYKRFDEETLVKALEELNKPDESLTINGVDFSHIVGGTD